MARARWTGDQDGNQTRSPRNTQFFCRFIRVSFDCLFQAPPDDLRKTHLVFVRDPRCLAIQVVLKLDLRFYHDGKLLTSTQFVHCSLVSLCPCGAFLIRSKSDGMGWCYFNPVRKFYFKATASPMLAATVKRGLFLLFDILCVSPRPTRSAEANVRPAAQQQNVIPNHRAA